MRKPPTTRTLTPAQTADLLKGGTRIAAGIWEDRHGHLHFSIPELLAFFGWPDDADHRAGVLRAIEESLAQSFPDTTEIVINEVES